jgi:hypothetical protein
MTSILIVLVMISNEYNDVLFVQEDTENEKQICSFLHDCIWLVVVHACSLLTSHGYRAILALDE